MCVCVCRLSHVQLCDPMDRSPPGSSVHRTLQARTLERVAISSSKDGIYDLLKHFYALTFYMALLTYSRVLLGTRQLSLWVTSTRMGFLRLQVCSESCEHCPQDGLMFVKPLPGVTCCRGSPCLAWVCPPHPLDSRRARGSGLSGSQGQSAGSGPLQPLASLPPHLPSTETVGSMAGKAGICQEHVHLLRWLPRPPGARSLPIWSGLLCSMLSRCGLLLQF